GYTSVNAFNLWGLGGLWVPDQGFFILGWVLFGCLSTFTIYVLYNRFDKAGELLAIFAAYMLFFGFFMLPTRIHERYLFPAISMLALMSPFIKKARALYVVLTATLLANTAYVLYWLNAYAAAGYAHGPNLTGDPVTVTVSLINLVTFIYSLLLLWNELKGRSWLKTNPAKTCESVEAKVEENRRG
ncbi:MAG: hypothetical protein N3E52_07065, partial [Candidatus Bathyarchaeota archaeon]|nr:hypothetical protein [Candidatus Bathyarchaeota archaeon]